MRRKALVLTTTALALGGTAWFAPDVLGLSFTPEPTGVTRGAADDRSDALAVARRAGSVDELTAFVDEQRARCAERPDDAGAHRVLAEAYLERCLTRDTRRGMAVGETTHDELPEANKADIDAGLAAVDRAIELGDPTADVHRIRSALLSLGVTGFASVLTIRPQADASLKAAEAVDAEHPRVIVARACEKLFAPNRFLGHDPAAAKRMFLLASDALPLDERPLIFASMCAWLIDENDDAVELMRRAVERNPRSAYATEVLRRLEAGEEQPFQRDV